MKPLLILFLSLITTCITHGQVIYTPEDSLIWEKTFLYLKSQSIQPLSQCIVSAGKQWLGTPYVAHTLEKGLEEKLVVNLSELDCTTFVESMLAMGKTMQQTEPSFNTYTQVLQAIRYRNGEIKGYPSRLHYFSEWLYENERQGKLQIITKSLGGKLFAQQINFMTTHRSAYPALQNDNFFQQMGKIETNINKQTKYYVPKAEINKIESKLQDGDIIAITSQINGLDVVHVGFAILQNKRIHLLHASTGEKKVVISAKPLSEYLLANKTQSGIMVARPIK